MNLPPPLQPSTAAGTPSTEATEARKNLDDAIRRDAELRAKPTLNGVEKAEMEGSGCFPLRGGPARGSITSSAKRLRSMSGLRIRIRPTQCRAIWLAK